MMNRIFTLFLLLLCSIAAGADFYISPRGSDSNVGSKGKPFATFRKGLSVLKAGDTLHIAPGDYAGAGSIQVVGTRERPIVVRAEIPGTVVIRGDKEVRGFKRVPDQRFIYAVDWRETTGGVKERDTLNCYLPASNLEQLKYNRKAWFHDVKNGKLYVVTSDGASPDEHLLTVSVGNPREGHGLQLIGKSAYVHIDGLNFTGFDSYIVKWGNNYYSVKSLLLNHSTNIKVTNCRFFLNGCGLTLWECKDSLVENCISYANFSLAVGSAANIYFPGKQRNCIVRNSVAFKSALSGIRFYSGKFPGCAIERCVAWGHGMSDLEIKAPDKQAVICESIGAKNAINTNVRNNITGANTYRLTPADDPTSLYWRHKKFEKQMNDHLADFDNWDGRPMSDSKFKGGLSYDKSVFFLAPGGSDSNSGTTIRAPKKSLRNIPNGATVYLMPGKYGTLTVTQNDIVIAGRGRYTKALVDALDIRGRGVTVRKLNFSKDFTVTGSKVKFENCSFAQGVVFKSVRDFTVVHCAFVNGVPEAVNSTGAVFSTILPRKVEVNNSSVYTGNNAYPDRIPAGDDRSVVCKALFKAPAQGDFTLKNPEKFAGRALDALPVGPYNRVPGVKSKGVQFAKVHRVTTDSAEIEWHLPTGQEVCSVAYNSVGGKKNYRPVLGEMFRTVTLKGLKPGTRYICNINSSNSLEERFLNTALTPVEEAQLKRGKSVQLDFTTPVKKAAAREYFVSVKGSDKSSGSKAAPFRTIEHALNVVSPGDTVTLRGGSYNERLFFRVSDLTLRGYPGEKVYLDGQRKLLNLITFFNKNNITIDNLEMRGVITTKREYIRAVNSSNIKISRIFFDGRWAKGYAPTPLYIYLCKNVLVENCVTMNSFRGLHFIQTDGIKVRNCVLSMNSLNQIHFNSFLKNYKAVIENNIICDMIPMKLANALIHEEHTHPGLKIENNCFYTRTDVHSRNFVGTWYGKGSGLHPLAHYRQAHPGKETNIFKDPLLPGLKLHKPPLPAKIEKKEYRATADGKSWEVLDFKDFFPADKEVRRRGMGLRESDFR
ncbi:MAG: DUF1565 domain-containing protein [Lentisphaerae bacterium]|nr:DUF1565 domain-containing protein [Lentisphaerota bacterium]